MESLKERNCFQKLTVVADAGLLLSNNVQQLLYKGYDFILGARVKNENQAIQDEILKLKLKNGESAIIIKVGLHLIIISSDDRSRKDKYNRQRGLKRLEKKIKTGRLTKSNINNKGYNKCLKLDGKITVTINHKKINHDAQWDGLKGYLTNSKMDTETVLENYSRPWQIEKAFRVAKNELNIRPVYHYKKRGIEAHICLNFTAYKVYKKLESLLKEKIKT